MSKTYIIRPREDVWDVLSVESYWAKGSGHLVELEAVESSDHIYLEFAKKYIEEQTGEQNE